MGAGFAPDLTNPYMDKYENDYIQHNQPFSREH